MPLSQLEQLEIVRISLVLAIILAIILAIVLSAVLTIILSAVVLSAILAVSAILIVVLGIVTVDKYVVMPNHVHMIVSISKPELYHNYQKEEFGKPTSESISSIVRSFKSAVTREAHNKFSDLNTPYKIWQPRYYDNIIRSEDAYWKICEYIDKNPERWNEDKFNFVNIK